MTHAEWIPIACGVLYLIGSGLYLWQGEVWPAWMYFGYAFANVGAIMWALKTRAVAEALARSLQ